MTKAQFDALELITTFVLAHQNCMNFRNALEDEKLQFEKTLNSLTKDLAEMKAKMEDETITQFNLKDMYNSELRKNADLQKRVAKLDELNQRVAEIQKSGNLIERLTIVEAHNMVLSDENEEQADIIVRLLENSEKQQQDNRELRSDIKVQNRANKKLDDDIQGIKEDISKHFNDNEENEIQKKIIKTLQDDNETQNKIIATLTEDIAEIKEINKKHVKANDELNEMIKKVLDDNECVHRRLKEVETKLTSEGK